MPRMPRGISLEKDGLYHLRGQAAGGLGYYPLQEDKNARKLMEIIRHYVAAYFCQAAAVEIMGSHYHLAVAFERYRKRSKEELQQDAERFYSGCYRPYESWTEEEWQRFNRRLFNVSELMRNIQQAFTRWFNRRHGRKGPFWAGRFQLTETEDLRETVYYIELNAVRAGLVRFPEQWRYGSAWMRRNACDSWLIPLEKLFQTSTRAEAERFYRVRLYWRGTEPKRDTDGVIPLEAAKEVEDKQRGRGCYLRRLDCFSRGGKIGSWQAIALELQRLRDAGLYRRRRHPVPVGVSDLYALRGPRRRYISLGATPAEPLA